MIFLKNISFSYTNFFPKQKTQVFKNLSLKFEKGKIYSITAPNGYGKTTLLKIIAGFLVPQEGNLFINNLKVNFKNFPYNMVSLFYNQEHMFYQQLTTTENLNFYGFKNINNIKNKLTYVNLNYNIFDTKFQNLSSGNKTKVALLKTIMEDREAVLLDEPFSYLDPDTKKVIKEYFKQKKADRCIIIATNNIDDICDISDTSIELTNVK